MSHKNPLTQEEQHNILYLRSSFKWSIRDIASYIHRAQCTVRVFLHTVNEPTYHDLPYEMEKINGGHFYNEYVKTPIPEPKKVPIKRLAEIHKVPPLKVVVL